MIDLDDRGKSGGSARAVFKIAAVVFILIGFGVWLSRSFIKKAEPEKSEAPAPFDHQPGTVRVERRVFTSWVDQVGSVRAMNEVCISSRIMAEVSEMHVGEGDLVSAGEGRDSAATILAVLDDSEILDRLARAESKRAAVEQEVELGRARLVAVRAQVESARASRDRVSSDYRRHEELYRNRAATRQQLEYARGQREMVEARLRALLSEIQATESQIGRSLAQKQQADTAVREARSMLEHTVIRAPFPGKIHRIAVDAGDMAIPGEPLICMEAPFRPELHVHVPESVRAGLMPGQELEVVIEPLGRSFHAKLREIQPRTDPSAGMALVSITLPPDGALANGMVGRVRIPQGEVQPMVIPRAALQEEQPPAVVVWHPERGRERRSITLGADRGDLVEVLSGLDEGEEVVMP
ncbi:MAG: efflux RND transporter periplasmic adaptor subunit [Syntrophobacteraceae bacterium]|jgi:multidrug resistance efflux pump|nr:efflux RND transporter periplasmic adaptor subunit [Syntrophobacteraceae bacterium]